MNYLKYNCVRIDWKAEIADTYFSFKNDWTDKQEILEDEKFISLIENYDSETPPEYLPALGQEFSSHNLFLYNVDEGDDHYCLILLEEDEKVKFEQSSKKQNIEFELLKQKRKRWGSPATRLKLSEQIQFEKQSINGFFWEFKYPISLIEEKLYNNEGNTKLVNTYLVDTKSWPLKCYKTSYSHYLASSKDNDIYCKIFVEKEKKYSIAKISKSPFESDSWIEINSKEKLPLLIKPFWINEDLLIIDNKVVWIVKSVKDGNNTCEKIFETDSERKFVKGEYPEVFNTSNGQTYILLYFKFYKWEKQKLINTGLSVIRYFSDFKTFPTGEHRFVYIADNKLIEVDFHTKKTRYRSLKFTDRGSSIEPYDKDWAVITRFGYTDKTIDIAQFWHPQTDTWVQMSLGKLGKYGVRDIFLHPKGYTLINTNEDLVLKVDNLLEKLKSDSKNIFSQPEWNEIWKDQSQLNFWGKLKSIFK